MKKLLFSLFAMFFCGMLMAQHTIEITLFTDRYASETTWNVKDISSNTTIAQGGPYTNASSNGTQQQTIAPIDVDGTGCYVFTIYDSHGDGIHGSYGNGYYTISYDGTVVVTNNNFTSSSASNFINPTSGSCAQDEIALTSLDVTAYPLMNQAVSIKGKVTNNGAVNLTSYTVRYQVDGGAWSADYTASCNVTPFNTHTFTHNVPYTFTTNGRHTINVEVSMPNSSADDVADNTASIEVIVNETSVPRKVLLEHFSTAQCPNCPPAHNNITNWLSTRPNIIHLIHHSGYYTDNFTCSEDNTLLAFYNDGGSTYAPAIMLDRAHITSDPGPVFFPSSSNPSTTALMDQRLNTPAFVTVNIDGTYDPTAHTINVTVSGDVVGDILEQNLRLSLYIMEDGLTGSQAGASGTYTHNEVMRHAISNVWGDANVVTPTPGSSYSKTYTYTLNTAWVPENLTLIAFVNNHGSSVNDRAILNAESLKISDLTVGVDETDLTHTTIYPNPATDMLYINSEANIQSIEIYNLQGQRVSVAGNTDCISIQNLSDGMYILRVTTDKGVSNHKITKK